MYIKHYLSEPDVRCSSHRSQFYICLHAGFKCAALSHLNIPWDQEPGTGYMGTTYTGTD